MLVNGSKASGWAFPLHKLLCAVIWISELNGKHELSASSQFFQKVNRVILSSVLPGIPSMRYQKWGPWLRKPDSTNQSLSLKPFTSLDARNGTELCAGHTLELLLHTEPECRQPCIFSQAEQPAWKQEHRTRMTMLPHLKMSWYWDAT